MALPLEEALELYRRMLRIRFFEKKMDFLFTHGQVHGTCHFSIGQEASAVGACAAIQEDDVVMSTHRGHGHALARGLPLNNLMAELMGRVDGFCSGRGGTQHVMSWKHHFIANGITGGTAVTGTGIALAFALKKEPRVVLSFSGDGAINEGHYHETLNLAAVWKLPIIFLCENNLYAMSTHTKESMVLQDISKRVESYGMKSITIDGNDIEMVKETVSSAVQNARTGLGPVFIECKTYRFSGHSKNDLFLYRTREEEAQWLKKDPIEKYEKIIKERYGESNETFKRIHQEVEQELDAAAIFAQNSPFPPEASLLDHCWCSEGGLP
ncbi:MAG: pyruvate dehydrogenase E1 component subunit alpha [archaeon GW2011_AR9]|nr:MAG: pyruvate dehydrogenase E1 component subunit alpha [archaeon GW2011_AR9]MBS3120652.1 thiamine pyrophosphate-dependent dehydrogenase E1 component subunit alpha [Candidatus Woesearchaeota archaeon]HIG93671.1 thiamine pyrophosphate-dependent dehydrogenase E1 component subunit alpha [Candidatus Woesearchaeota archaeon]HIH13012.1 thiamine pyrophosphate-dependent dehydrogenase E1 component subunit alpha [Candidatus Woesearchaeota archaeon]